LDHAVLFKKSEEDQLVENKIHLAGSVAAIHEYCRDCRKQPGYWQLTRTIDITGMQSKYALACREKQVIWRT